MNSRGKRERKRETRELKNPIFGGNMLQSGLQDLHLNSLYPEARYIFIFVLKLSTENEHLILIGTLFQMLVRNFFSSHKNSHISAEKSKNTTKYFM